MPHHGGAPTVLLVRHGETHGYHDDVGLTGLGESQARDAGAALAATLPPGARVRLPHAPTRRATATARVLRAALLDALGPDTDVEVGPLEPDARFDSLQFLHDGVARESSGVAADRLRHRRDGDGAPAGWTTEYDRFDSDYGAASKLGGPIDRWMVATTRHFEPPQVMVYRAWAGVLGLVGAGSGAPTVAIVSSHSALLRAFAAAAVGHDPGEPANLEHVAVTVDGPTARVRYRGHDVVVEVPTAVPPWLDPAYLAGARAARPWPGA